MRCHSLSWVVEMSLVPRYSREVWRQMPSENEDMATVSTLNILYFFPRHHKIASCATVSLVDRHNITSWPSTKCRSDTRDTFCMQQRKTWNFDYACTSTMSVTQHIFNEDLQLLWKLGICMHESIDHVGTGCTWPLWKKDWCIACMYFLHCDWRPEGMGLLSVSLSRGFSLPLLGAWFLL